MGNIQLQSPTEEEIAGLKYQKTQYKGGPLIAATPQKKDPDSPATTSLAYDIMLPRWNKIEAVLGGTESMRAAGERYLPRHPEEGLPKYMERLMRSTLFNMTELTLDGWVGKPFGEEVEVPDDMPDNIKEMLENIDLQGNNIDVFARHWFREGVAKGFCHVLVDNPKVDKEVPRTLAQDRIENVRPYFTLIAPENLIFAKAEIIDGVEVLTHVRIRECITEMDGFMEVTKHQIRVLEPGIGRVYQKVQTKGKKERWTLTEEYTYDLPFIPLVTFYAAKDGLMLCKPPITDLVDLNVAHWQSSSDQRSILTVARFPMLALSGSANATGDEISSLVIGPNQILVCPDPQGKYYYVEHEGNSIEAGRKDLQDLESQMASYGSEFLKKRPGSTTATARALDSAEATSPLQDMVVRFNDALNQATYFLGLWIGIDKLPDLEVCSEFEIEDPSNQADLTALTAARTNRDISRESFLEELKNRGILSEEFDIEEDASKLENELMTGATSLDLLNPQEPNNGPANAQ